MPRIHKPTKRLSSTPQLLLFHPLPAGSRPNPRHKRRGLGQKATAFASPGKRADQWKSVLLQMGHGSGDPGRTRIPYQVSPFQPVAGNRCHLISPSISPKFRSFVHDWKRLLIVCCSVYPQYLILCLISIIQQSGQPQVMFPGLQT